MTTVEFRLTTGAHGEYKVLGSNSMSDVPAVGEVVNVDGDPFVVHRRGWATRTGAQKGHYHYTQCYLEVSPLQGTP